jgi:DNA-binding response OmpR family regulator
VVHDNRERLTRVLQGHELIFVDNSHDARALLERERFGLVMLGVHFDDSQMFSLLGDIRAHAQYRKVPILCVLGSWGACFPRSRSKGSTTR